VPSKKRSGGVSFIDILFFLKRHLRADEVKSESRTDITVFVSCPSRRLSLARGEKAGLEVVNNCPQGPGIVISSVKETVVISSSP
jgi:hypothetical protein